MTSPQRPVKAGVEPNTGFVFPFGAHTRQVPEEPSNSLSFEGCPQPRYLDQSRRAKTRAATRKMIEGSTVTSQTTPR